MKFSRFVPALVLCLALGACAGGPDEHLDEQRAADANAALGIDYMRKGNYEQALSRLRRALSYDDEHVDANWALALTYGRLQEYDKADTHFRRALDVSPSPPILNSYGAFLCERGRVEDAVRYFDRAADNPRYASPADALANAGLCLVRTGREAEGEDYFRRALEHDPEHAAALERMARLEFGRGDHLGARAFLQRRADAGPLDRELLLLAARNELALGDRDEARRYLRRYNADESGAPVTLEQLSNQRASPAND